MNTRTGKGSIYIIGALFFIFGFATWVNSVLIPYLKQICELSDFQSYFVAFAFYISYFVMALPSSWVLRRCGFVKGMSVGLFCMGVGSLVFIPAALACSYGLFLAGLFIQGAGLSLLQTASNPYVTVLGPIESAAQRISIMGICNKVAGMIGIFLLSSLLFSGLAHTDTHDITALSHKIIAPYALIAIVMFVLSTLVHYARLPEIKPEKDSADAEQSTRPLKSFSYLWLGVAALFLYVGAEVVSIDTLPLYGEYFGMKPVYASKLGTFSLISLVAGYLIGIFTMPRFISQRIALVVCTILNLILVSGAVLSSGVSSVVFIILLSFGNSLMWPSIWPLSIEKLGRHTETASAFLIMAIAGGAVMPLVYGACADALGGNRQLPYLLLVPCYLFIMFFALKGYKIGKSGN